MSIDLNFDRYSEITLDNQKIVAGLMVIEAFTGQRQLYFSKTEVLNRTTQTWELHLVISLGNQVIMSQTISANQDGAKKQILLSSDMLSFSSEQRVSIRKKYDMIVESLFKKLQESEGISKQNTTKSNTSSDRSEPDCILHFFSSYGPSRLRQILHCTHCLVSPIPLDFLSRTDS